MVVNDLNGVTKKEPNWKIDEN